MDTPLERVWNLLSHNTLVHWFAKHPVLGAVSGGAAHSPQNLHTVMTNLNGWNLYAHANGVRSGFRGLKPSSRDIEVWRYAIVDVDPSDAQASPIAAGHQLWKELGGILIDTGRGVQLWVPLLDVQQALEDASWFSINIERALGFWLRTLRPFVEPHGCIIDTSCSDLSRVVRLPGSTNWRTKCGCHIIEEGRPKIDSRPILNHVRDIPPPETEPRREIKNLSQAIPHLSERAARFLTEGVERGGRHQAAFATAASLRDIGVSQEQAEAYVIRGGELCGFDFTFTPQDCTRATRNAFGKLNKGLDAP